jgi:hypothetical protein
MNKYAITDKSERMSYCVNCGEQIITGTGVCPKCQGTNFGDKKDIVCKKTYLKDTPENRAKKMSEYKVIGQEDEWLNGGRFDKYSLEKMLNHYALEGWKVREISASKTYGIFFGTPRDEMIIILERDMPLSPV